MKTEFIESTINDFIKVSETKNSNELENIINKIDDCIRVNKEIKNYYVNYELIFGDKNAYVINLALLDNQDNLESINFIYEV